MLSTVIRYQSTLLFRERRVALFTCLILAMIAVSFGNGFARQVRWSSDRVAAEQVDAESWKAQGVVNPHYAAHFGRHAFKPVSALAMLDPGVLDYVGTLVRLEAHRQHPAGGSPTDADTALASFSPFTVAGALTIFAPLVLVLAGFSTFSGESARQLLRQELAAGISPATLLWGRALALSGGVLLILLLVGGVAAIILLQGDAPALGFQRLALMLAGYGVYLFTMVILIMGVSACCRSAPLALTALLALWLVGSLLVPRLAPMIAADQYPIPSLPELNENAAESFATSLDAGNPKQTRTERVRALALEKYGVKKVEDLPVNLSGFTMEYSETLSTQAYRRHFAEVQARYAKQRDLQRVFSIFSPMMAIKAWSAVWAETDVAAHQRFLSAAEDYRYELVQTLNRDYRDHPPKGISGNYETDVGALTATLGNFTPPTVGNAELWPLAWPSGAVLLLWSLAAAAFGSVAVRQLGRRL